MKCIQLLPVSLLFVGLFSGCALNNSAKEDVRDGNGPEVQNYNYDRNSVNNQAKLYNLDQGTNADDNQMSIVDDAQAKVEAIDEVKNANVIVTNRNAYVAVVLDDDETGNVRKDIEEKISREVKASDQNIENVYVSSNPDFVDRMNDYGGKIQSGKPIRGLFEEFNEMVQSVFPTAR